MNIVCTVTTCPRQVTYLAETLTSLRVAGFDPLVFEDPNLKGSRWALRNALGSLLARYPEADVYAVFQDDILAAKGLCGWLERNLWPADPATIGICSPYTASVNSQPQPGWFDLNQIPVFRPFGACSLIFPNHSAKRFLAESRPDGMLSGSDTQVGLWCRSAGLGHYSHTPSLIQHVGKVSSICLMEIGLDNNRSAGDFCEDCAILS